MARTKQTPEAQVLAYFRTAPLGEAVMVAGLVKGLMAERAPAPKRKPPKAKPTGPNPTQLTGMAPGPGSPSPT